MVVAAVGLAAIRCGDAVPIAIDRLATVAPPSVKATREELAVGVFPVQGTCLGVENIVH